MWLTTDGSRVQQQFGTVQGHDARRLREPLVPAHRGANAREACVPHLEAGVTGGEVELLVVTRALGNVRFAVVPQHGTTGIHHHQRVVEAVAVALVNRHRQHHLQLRRQPAQQG